MAFIRLEKLNKHELIKLIRYKGFKITQEDISSIRKDSPKKTNLKRKKSRKIVPLSSYIKVPKLSVKLSEQEYRILVNEVYERDGYKCTNPDCSHKLYGFNCLTPHHLIKRSNLRLDVKENLITVCKICHGEIDDFKLKIDWIVKNTFLEKEDFIETWQSEVKKGLRFR